MNTVLLVFVGFGSSKKSNSDFMSQVVSLCGYSALVVDLSGHGESPFNVDDISPAQHLLEATKAYDWLKSHHPEKEIYVMGTSYGGFIAAYLTRYRDVKKLVLRTPAIYEPSMFYDEHRFIDKHLVREYRKSSDEIGRHPLFHQSPLDKVPTLLVIHSDDDSIPVETTYAYSEAFSAKVYIAKGFVHAFRDPSNPKENIPEYYETISSWLKN